MKGASDTSDGTNGLVPQPALGDQDKYLKADGTLYVGVTPGKYYDLYHFAQGDDYYNISIFYSSKINTHTPQVKDY